MRYVPSAVPIVLALALAAGTISRAEGARVQGVAGTVVAVTPTSRTIVVESELDGQPWIIGAEVTGETKFAGRVNDLADLKPGDRVTIQWVREENRLAAIFVETR
jgi:hypothetical protein